VKTPSIVMRSALVVLLAACVVAPGARAASVTVAVASARGAPGAEVKVPVSVRGAQGLGALQMELVYDPAVLEARKVEEGALLSGAMVESNVPQPGRMRVALVSGEPVNGDGVLLMARFVACGAAGKECQVQAENARAWEHSTNLDMRVSVEPGKFTVAAAGLSPVLLGAIAAIVAIVLVAIVAFARRKRPSVAPPPFPEATPSYPAGAQQPRQAFCTQCGARVEPGARFCAKCGGPLSPA